MLFYAVNRKNEKVKLKGVVTNSNKLKETKDPKKGLQENRRKQGSGAEQGKKKKAAKDSDGQVAKDGETVGTFQSPAVLPDSEGEDLNISPTDTVDDINRLAWKAYYADNADLAVRLFTISLEKEPNNLHSVSGLGKAYEKKGQKELAVKQYCKVATLPSVETKDVEYWLGHADQLGSSCKK